MTIKVKNGAGIKFSGVKIYRSISNQCTEDTFVFNNKEIASFDETGAIISGSEMLVMEDYGDFINSDPILMLFTLTTPSTLDISATTATTKFGSPVTASNYNSYPLSNAVCFKYSTSILATDDTYEVSSFSSSLSSFVTSIPSAGSTSNLASRINIFNSGSTEVSQVGIIVDYYEDAVKFIRSNLLSDEDDGYAKVTFTCDWSMVVAQ